MSTLEVIPQTPMIYKHMANILADVEAIEKERKNTQGQGYNFRGIDDVMNAMHPLFAKHKVFVVPTVLSRVREERETKSGGTLIYTMLEVRYTFYAQDGSSVAAVATGEAFDSGDKSSNKAMSAAMKYAILQTFCIPTIEDKDTENNTPDVKPRPDPGSRKADDPKPPQAADKAKKTVTDAQVKRLFAITHSPKSVAAGWTPDNVRGIAHMAFEVDSTNDINMAQYDKLCGWVEKEDYIAVLNKLTDWIATKETKK